MSSPAGRLTARLLFATLAIGVAAREVAGWQEIPPGKVTDKERTLVVEVHRARKNYQESLERLRGYYVRSKNDEQRYWAEREMTQYHMMVKDPYILDLDLPDANLRPDKNIPQANNILRDAIEHLNKPTLMETDKNQHRAEVLLRRLINDYPQSDKVDEACYYLGEIYSSKYFEQYRRAVAFYERCLQYEPDTRMPARLKAAIVYEKNLADWGRAKELYQEIMQKQIEPGQTKEAGRRLEKLLGARRPAR
ncbi:MAG TPA: hypothetical protein VNC50_15745 [Planctomycetia bacterium]|jgi:hypothetical protein|nr:hypothetical protein [Planctomycetia bacterium]